jgi:hypothetical protein
VALVPAEAEAALLHLRDHESRDLLFGAAGPDIGRDEVEDLEGMADGLGDALDLVSGLAGLEAGADLFRGDEPVGGETDFCQHLFEGQEHPVGQAVTDFGGL